jgi:ABC-type glycerol-3-phosphate transport system permease component
VLTYLVFEMLILPLCLCEMYSCAIVTSIWRWDLKFDMLITTDNRFFVRKCGGWCHYFKFAFKLVFL